MTPKLAQVVDAVLRRNGSVAWLQESEESETVYWVRGGVARTAELR